MKRVIILMLDSVGIGATDDADQFGDAGANTLGHIATWCYAYRKNPDGSPAPLSLPNLNLLGLGLAAKASSGNFPVGLDPAVTPIASYGFAEELSTGKDTSSGHWELTGVPVLFDWDYFPNTPDCFPKDLLDEIYRLNNLTGSLGNCHASGTDIIQQLGKTHQQTHQPIFYTSADSVFQVACHEESFGLDNLYQLCISIREILDASDYKITRVIARPFMSADSETFKRTENRKDYSVKPHDITILEKLITERSGDVISIGKIADIYANVGITQKVKASSLKRLFDETLDALDTTEDQSIIFTNFVNFDADFGHRRNIAGYANALEYFDDRLPEILEALLPNDLLFIVADHGCDPAWRGTDHTREHIPILLYSSHLKPVPLGKRTSFADVGQTIASYFDLSPMEYGTLLLPHSLLS